MPNTEAAPENAALTSQNREGRKSPERSPNRKSKDSRVLKSETKQRLKELQQENAKLKRIVVELSLQKLTLRDILASKGL
jgi:hypothetical protein